MSRGAAGVKEELGYGSHCRPRVHSQDRPLMGLETWGKVEKQSGQGCLKEQDLCLFSDVP